MKQLILVLVLTVALQSAEAVYIEFSGTPGSTPLTMTFAEDVDFVVTAGQSNQIGTMIYVVMEDLFASPDPSLTAVFSSGNPGELLELSVNETATLPCWNWFDHFETSGNDISTSDSYFGYEGPAFDLVVGDVITLKAGSMVSYETAPVDFQLPASGEYELFLWSSYVTQTGPISSRISEYGVVPEPASALLLGIGTITIWIRRMNRRYL